MIRWIRNRIARVQWLNLERRFVELHGPAGRALIRNCKRDGMTPFAAAVEHMDMLIRAHRMNSQPHGRKPDVADSQPELRVSVISPVRIAVARDPGETPQPYSASHEKTVQANVPNHDEDNAPVQAPTPAQKQALDTAPDTQLIKALRGLGLPAKEAIERARKACAQNPDASLRERIALAMKGEG